LWQEESADDGILREGKEGTVWMVLWEERSGNKKI
jgi:hypothetical protein